MAIFKHAIESDQINIDYVWRIFCALGILSAICTIYSRFHLPVSARYFQQVLKNIELAEQRKTIRPDRFL
ncbi:hypothetical protein I4U23_017506 [Adineta vaga]|nr:hypothetical protein I4U23_017506 [Adineta vaga]